MDNLVFYEILNRFRWLLYVQNKLIESTFPVGKEVGDIAKYVTNDTLRIVPRFLLQ